MKIVLPGQDVTIDTPNGVDPVWYEKLSQLNAKVQYLETNLLPLIVAGGAGGAYADAIYTPVLSAPGGTLPTFTATPLQGRYTRIGRMVSLSMYANNTAGGVNGAGAFQLSVTLPIPANVGFNPIRVMLGVSQNSGVENVVLGEIGIGGSTITLFKMTGTSQVAALNCADLNNVSRTLELFGWYRVD